MCIREKMVDEEMEHFLGDGFLELVRLEEESNFVIETVVRVKLERERVGERRGQRRRRCRLVTSRLEQNWLH